MERKLEDVEYELELDRIIREIKKEKAKRVLLQFPDALKLYSCEVVKELRKKVDAEIFIWLGSCFGACDIPNVDEKDFDLIVQFGHSAWDYGSDIKVVK